MSAAETSPPPTKGTTRRRVLRYVLPGVAVCVVVALALAWLLPERDIGEMQAMTSPDLGEVVLGSTVATTAVEDLQVFAAPDESSELVTTLSERTEYDIVRTLLVVDRTDGWYQALLPIRPNGATGWVRADDVTTSTTNYRMEISLSAREVVLYDGSTEVMRVGAAIGTDATPTPPGHFYVTDPLDLRDQPGTGYGAYAIGISGFSEVLESFAGGPGQLAVHGAGYPSTLGEQVSNGCVRLLDEDILRIAEIVPLGTPVIIEA